MKTLNADENERKTYKANVSRICPKSVTRMKTFQMRMKIKEQLRWIGHLNVNTSIIYRWIEIVLETKNIGSPSLFHRSIEFDADLVEIIAEFIAHPSLLLK